MKNLKYTTYLLFLLLSIVPFCDLKSQVTIEKLEDNWQLKINGEDFEIHGITFGPVDDTANYDAYFKDLQSLGVNAIRTWATGKNAKKLLDTADKYGIKVMMGIWMRHGRPGMEDDDSFNYLKDKEGMKAMYDNAINVVTTYKDHPAVLTWGIGNEVYLNMATDEEKLAYSKLLEKICKQMKTIDPNHPITSVEAWTFGIEWWHKHVPSIDIYGLNTYGFGANLLQGELDKMKVDKPYIVSEFGVRGEWDIKAMRNNIKIEPTDTEKYEAIANGVPNWILNKPNNLGVFVFHYSDGNQHMAPWLFTHYKGAKRPQYWAVRKVFTGKEPSNKVPKILKFSLPDGSFESGTWVKVTLTVSDTEKDIKTVKFSFNHREGSRKRRDQINTLEFRGTLKNGYEIKLPKIHGAIKVYAEVYDEANNVGIASSSVMVTDKEEQKKKFLVPKANLPFYVYRDAENMPYTPSAYMGNVKGMQVDMAHTKNVKSGKTAIELKYTESKNWYGLGLVDPANDWGDILGGYDISGARTFSFWAKASYKGVKAKIGFGMIEQNKKYPDSAIKTEEFVLTDQWKKYTIKTKRLNLSHIRSGFVLFAAANGFQHTIYLDDIVFE
ncbi:MAG: hypothetical protein CMB99_12205 [Flavobacteriaceae bacterium]|nr:hypothetical protein [Flavobacteriaceae bacterium]